MRSKVMSGLIGAGVATLALTVLRSPGGGPATVLAPVSYQPSPIEAALDRPLDEVRFDGTPFERAIADLSELSGVPIEVEWPAETTLQLYGMARDKPISLRVRHTTLDDALSQVLDAGKGDADLGYAVEGGRIVVGLREGLAGRTLVRSYDVSRLLTAPASEHGMPMLDLRPRYYDASTDRALTPADRRALELRRLVVDAFYHANWRNQGDGDRDVFFVGGRMVVAQPWQNQRNVRRLLDQLHQSPAPPRPPECGAEAWSAELNRFVPMDPAAADAILRRVVPEVELRDATLAEAVEALRRLWRADIVLRLDPLVERGFDPDNARFDLRLRNLNLAAALKALTDACPMPENLSIGFGVERGVIIVAPRHEGVCGSLVTRSYDLRDWYRRAMAEMALARPQTPGQWQASYEYEASELYKRCHDALIETIQNLAAPGTWGYSVNEPNISDVGGQLLITQTWENHEAVATVIDALLSPPTPLRAGSAAPVTTAAAASSPAQSSAEEALRRVVPELRIDALPFEQAIQRLRDASGADILLDHAGLAHTAFYADRAITLHLKGATLADALDLLLRMAWAPVSLDYMPHEPAIVITSANVVSKWPLLRVYDIADLTADDSPVAPEPPASASTTPGSGPSARQRRGEAVARFIEQAAGATRGFEVAKPSVLAGRMVVSGSFRGQRRVEALLRELRRGQTRGGHPPSTRPTTWSATPMAFPLDDGR